MSADYTVLYSKRKTVGISVERDRSVVVRVPEGTSDEEIRRVVSAKKRWIDNKVQHPQKYRKNQPPGKELVSGESMLFLGRSYRVELVESDSDQVDFDETFRVPRSLSDRGRAIFRDWYLRAARETLIPRAQDWAQTLGVQPGTVTVTDVRYRWGSCTADGNVSLNWRLVKAPVAVSDYVIVHELAHLLEATHGERFWSIIRSQIPKVDHSRDWLREHGQLLEQDL